MPPAIARRISRGTPSARILTAVYGATLLYWLRDTSEDDAATLAFLDRRLAGIGRFGKLRGRATAALRRVTPPLRRPA